MIKENIKLNMEKKSKNVQLILIILSTILIITPVFQANIPNNFTPIQKENIPIVLYNNSTRHIDINNTIYEISGTNALSALLIAADNEKYSYVLNDDYASSFGLFIESINSIENEGGDGWQYWVNYPTEKIPMISADSYELNDGDSLSWFYGGYGYNPENSKHVINLEIIFQSDEIEPSLSVTKPIPGGVYFNNDLKASLPFNPSIIINSLSILVDAIDEESGISHVTFAIDNQVENIEHFEPYKWDYEPKSGIHFTTLTITVTDRCDNQKSITHALITIV
jgi:hypothetical protein